MKVNFFRSTPPEMFLGKGVLQRTPMPKCDFNNVAKQFYYVTFRHEWSPEYLLYKIYVRLPNVFTFNLHPVSAGKGIPQKSLANFTSDSSDFVIYLFYVLFLFISANFVSQFRNFF